MNQINPAKLAQSKWTAVTPKNKEKHFIVTDVDYDDEGRVIECVLEAIMSKQAYSIDWRELKDTQRWRQGWV